jgi:hypothetical protein
MHAAFSPPCVFASPRACRRRAHTTAPAPQVRVLDAWGNPTAPTPQLPFQVAIASSGLEPGQAAFAVDERGVATVSGLAARRTDGPPPALTQPGSPRGAGGGPDAQLHGAKIWPQIEGLPPPRAVEAAAESAAAGDGDGGEVAPAVAGPASEEEEALALAVVARSAYGDAIAAAVAGPPAPLGVRLGVLPSTMPAKLMFVYQVGWVGPACLARHQSPLVEGHKGARFNPSAQCPPDCALARPQSTLP